MERKSVAEMRAANMPHATCESLGLKFTITDDEGDRAAAEATRDKAYADTDEYLKSFAASDKCPDCGLQLRGRGILHALLGGFEWGLAYGEGRCTQCGYPCRAYHRNVGPLEFLDYILAYHPDALIESEVAHAGN